MSQNPNQSEDATMLGDLILGQNPYGTATRLGASAPNRPALAANPRQEPARPFQPVSSEAAIATSAIDNLELDGMAQGHFNKDRHRLTPEDVAGLRAIPQKGVWWYFNGAPRYVAKAMRLPYTYTTHNEAGQAIEVTDYLLIGFEGAGW